MLGKEPKDWDICTNATPEEMLDVFNGMHLLDVGLKHGTLTVVLNKEGYEVTTYRIDGDYSDGRHPDEVKFTNSLEQDLSRRDFTINALAYSEEMGLIDFFGGMEDLVMRRLKAVGDPYKRFSEDALRIMRGVRFASVLGFDIDEKTSRAMYDLKENLENISVERLNVEFTKTLTGCNADKMLREFRDIIAVFIPEIKDMFEFSQCNPYHDFDVWEHTLHTVKEVECTKELRLAAFFHDIGKPFKYVEDEKGVGHFYGHPSVSASMVEEIMRRLHYSVAEIESVKLLVANHDVVIEPKKRVVLRLLRTMGTKEKLEDLIALRFADVKGQRKLYDAEDERIIRGNETIELLEQLELEEQCFTLKHLAVNGVDLMTHFDMKPGKGVGVLLNMLLEAVIDGVVENNKEDLFAFCVRELEV